MQLVLYEKCTMKRYEFAIAVASIYLLVYVLMIDNQYPFRIIYMAFALSPIPVLWMVYEILKNAVYTGPELKPDEEYGYQDVDKNRLGPF